MLLSLVGTTALRTALAAEKSEMSNENSQSPLAETVLAAVQATLTPEYVSEKVASHMQKLLDGAIQDALQQWSPTGKEIRRAVQDSLQVAELNLPSYGHIVTQILEAQIQATVAEAVASKLQKDMEGLLKLAPKQIKLSELIADLLGEDDDSCHCDIKEIWLDIDANDEYSSLWLYIDPDGKPKTPYDAKIRLLISTGKRCQEYGPDEIMSGTISSGHVSGSDLKKDVRFGYGTDYPNQRRPFGRWFGFEQKILALYALGTVITLDKDNCILSHRED